jgi:N-acetylgalactosamine kinase
VTTEFAPLLERLHAAFPGSSPVWLVRAPGRINLIGEHTDYNGFPVMPMAIERAVRIVCAPRSDGAVELRDANDRLYRPRRFELARQVPPYEPGDWGNYAKAAVQGLIDYAAARGQDPAALRGMSCVVDGDIPVEAGLSSSTALVVACALAFARVNAMHIQKRRMAELTAEAEHYVGTRGGGMDQAACMFGERGKALKIDFFPLRVEPVPFPADCCIVAAHSTINAKKTGGRREAYNSRVAECGVGVHVLARAFGDVPGLRLADMVRPRRGTPEQYVDLLRKGLGGRETLEEHEGAGLYALGKRAFRARYGVGPGGSFKVVARCRHVLTEADRTERAARALQAGHVEEVGRLMNESHVSCAGDYEISCPELDELVSLMRGAGALGARLTGAGFGGFAIALARLSQAHAIRRAVEERFYAPRRESPEGRLFTFRPAEGAKVRKGSAEFGVRSERR